MSKRLPIHVPADAPDQPPIWRSVEEKADPTRRTREAVEEQAVQVPEASLLGRRRFFAVTGATAAAVGLSGCLRRPAENILPFSQAPEYVVPGVPLHYATTVEHHGVAMGLLVETHEGRPTKVEGNPLHTFSMGSTDAQLQALTAQLYDPDRPAHPTRGGEQVSWSDFDAWWRERAQALTGNGGRGLAVLMEPTSSPSYQRAREALRARFPEARIHTWAPVPPTAAEGARLAFGEPFHAVVDYLNARRVLSIDCDFLGLEPGAVRNTRRWAESRRLDGPAEDTGRLYVVESSLSVTGANADNRLRLAPSRIEAYLRALAGRLARMDGIEMPSTIAGVLRDASADGVPEAWIEQVAADLVAHRGRSVVCVGQQQPARVHALAHAINLALGNVGQVVRYFAPTDAQQPNVVESLRQLVTAMSDGQVETLVILGGNPVYDAPADLRFADALGRVQTSIHLSMYDDETSARCTWFLPRAHAFETWGDHRAPDGTISIQQPLISPLRRGRGEHEVLAMLGGIRGWRANHLVRGTLQQLAGSTEFERAWRQSLHRGTLVGGPQPEPVSPTLREGDVAEALRTPIEAVQGWEVVFAPSYQTYDGRLANSAWMLEMPDPVTKLVWDNAAYLSPTSAQELGARTGDLLQLSRDGVEALTIPALVLPGHPDRVVTLPLGFGRQRAGRNAVGSGFDVYPFRSSTALGFATGVAVSKAGGTYELVQTQTHHSMEGRPLAIDATLEDYRRTPDFGQRRSPTPHVSPLWSQVDYSQPRPPAAGGTSYSLLPSERTAAEGAPPRYKWGFIVDLTTCTGCSACVVACQAENNIPVVGKRQVQLGREMHWMRIDRYFIDPPRREGESLEDHHARAVVEPLVATQPVACQHCEEAPCENVCPVNATAHSPEGLNDMAYNRCIGTRYCMNNCPYKVRRFNFLDWHGDLDELERMQFNPNVTVRMRGVMEKCTYCVQRIQYARIRSRTETRVNERGDVIERRIRPEEVTPACAQACPAEAITFGDLNDTSSRVHALAQLDRQYSLLASIGTQPRTRFLGKIRNPNRELV
jgi:molybdopterin-containing oxidoreductase family iron-sulfur binding subunit